MRRARLISTALVSLAATAACKSGDSKEAAASSGPPCAKVLAAVDRFAAGELFPGPSMVGNPPRANGKPFEIGDRPVRFRNLEPDAFGLPPQVVGPDDGGPIYIRASGRLPAEKVKWLVGEESEWRLVVERPIGISDVWKMVEEAAPPPKSLEDWWPKLKKKSNDGFGLDVIGPELADGIVRTAGRCGDAVSAATGALRNGEWGAGAAKALHAELPKCKCEGMDEPGFALVVSVMLVSSNPRLSYGWLPIDRNVFHVLPPDATVDALAARLASPEPIPEPPPPPPPPPPVRPRSKANSSD